MFSKGILPCVLAIWLFQVVTCAPSYDSWIRSVHNDDDSFVRVKRQEQGVASGASGKPVVDIAKITAPINADGKDKPSPIINLPMAQNDASSSGAKEIKAGDVAPASSLPTTATAPPTPKIIEDKPKEEKNSQSQAQGSSSDEGRNQNEPEEIKEAMLIIDGRGDANYATDDDNMDGAEIMAHRCARVRCTPPPNGFECKAKPMDVTDPIPQLIGLTSECCPVHVCRRQDGSTFLHYAIEVDDDGNANANQLLRAPQATFSASYSLLSNNGNNNGNGMQFPSQRSSNMPFTSSMFPPIFPFFPPPSSFSISSNKQASSPGSSSSRNGPPPSFGGILFPSKSDQESDRFSFPNSASSIQIVLPPSQNGNKYPSPSAGSQRVSQNVLSNSPLLSLDRIVRNVAFGAPPQLPQFNSGPYQTDEGQRARRNVFVNNWQSLPVGGMPIRPAASPYGGFPMFPF